MITHISNVGRYTGITDDKFLTLLKDKNNIKLFHNLLPNTSFYIKENWKEIFEAHIEKYAKIDARYDFRTYRYSSIGDLSSIGERVFNNLATNVVPLKLIPDVEYGKVVIWINSTSYTDLPNGDIKTSLEGLSKMYVLNIIPEMITTVNKNAPVVHKKHNLKL